MTTTTTTSRVYPNLAQFAKARLEIKNLLMNIKSSIHDDDRHSEDSNIPGIMVTIGVTVSDDGDIDWDYQTGDNSYSGAAYHHSNWGVVYLERRTNCKNAAGAALDEALDHFMQR